MRKPPLVIAVRGCEHAVASFDRTFASYHRPAAMGPPAYTPLKGDLPTPARRRPFADRTALAAILSLALIAPFSLVAYPTLFNGPSTGFKSVKHPLVVQAFKESVGSCARLNTLPGPPKAFSERTKSDRFVEVSGSVWVLVAVRRSRGGLLAEACGA